MDFRTDFEERESFRKFVPWFSIDEFKAVYNNLFSNDLKAVRQGYEHLLMWKARWPALPSGIEAMFNLCEVVLQDGKHDESSAELYIPQLRLMYATTIMRFLNLVLGTTPGKVEKRTLFHQADEVGIPKWIVDIRHDSAHGSVMPDIGVLRSAARFSINWLKERYWQPALHISDLVVVEGERIVTDYEQVVEKVMECWGSFAIYETTGYTSKQHVYQPELWEIINQIGASLKSKRHRPTQKVEQVAEALPILYQKMKELLRNRSNVYVKGIFTRKMITADLFLPSEKLLSLFKTKADEELPQQLIDMWRNVMKELWENGAIPELITQLINVVRDDNETPSRRRYSILWLQQILKSLIMVRESRKMLDAIITRSANFQLSHVYVERYPNRTYQEQLNHAVTDAIITLRPELKDAYSWATISLPHFVQSNELLRKCVANPPPPNIHTILPSVMELMHPPLPVDMQNYLLECVRIYSGQETSSKVPIQDKLYCLADILGQNSDLGKLHTEFNGSVSVTEARPSENSDLDKTELLGRSPWKRSSEILSWSKCSFGILPWQYDDSQKVWKSFEVKRVWKRGGRVK